MKRFSPSARSTVGITSLPYFLNLTSMFSSSRRHLPYVSFRFDRTLAEQRLIGVRRMKKSDVNGAQTNDVFKWLKSQKSQLGMERIKCTPPGCFDYTHRQGHSHAHPKGILKVCLFLPLVLRSLSLTRPNRVLGRR